MFGNMTAYHWPTNTILYIQQMLMLSEETFFLSYQIYWCWFQLRMNHHLWVILHHCNSDIFGFRISMTFNTNMFGALSMECNNWGAFNLMILMQTSSSAVNYTWCCVKTEQLGVSIFYFFYGMASVTYFGPILCCLSASLSSFFI